MSPSMLQTGIRIAYSVRAPLGSRLARFQAPGLNIDPRQVEEAREWLRSFNTEKLPKGLTTFSRSSGAGGQHVNKTESKATTVWSVVELMSGVPSILQYELRKSRFYTSGNDSLTFHAQTERRRESNIAENRTKLANELRRMYKAVVPGEIDAEDVKRHEDIEKNFHKRRIQDKKLHSAKKKSRRGSQGE